MTTTPLSGASRTVSVPSIDTAHYMTHEGRHFYVSGFEELDLDEEVIFSIKTGSDRELHLIFNVEAQSQTEMRIYESGVVTTGTLITPINSYRSSSNISTAAILKAPTITKLGNLIYEQSSGKAGTTPSRADLRGSLGREQELILKENTTTIFKIKSKDDTNVISYLGEWYEEQD